MTDLVDFARRVGEDASGTAAALEILLRVTVLLSTAMLVAGGLRRTSAALRHLVWTLSLGGTLLIPLCYWAFPAWQWAILPQRQHSASPSIAGTGDSPNFHGVGDGALETDAIAAQMGLSRSRRSEPAVSGYPTPIVKHPTVPLLRELTWSWPVFFAALWALGTSLGFVWLGIGIVGAWYVAWRAKPITDLHWRHILQQILAPCGFRRPIEIRQCSQVSVPMTWGVRRPVILVPAVSASWPEATKRSVLLHELGHIQRGDCLVHLLGRLACAVYWFHPLVWLAAAQLRKTSEQAADDVVLSSNIAPPDYAEHLVGIAGQMRGIHLFGHVALPMASPSDLESRVLAILDPQRNRRSLKRKTCYALMIVAALLLIPCALLRLGYAEDKKSLEQPPTAKSSARSDTPLPSNADAGAKEESPGGGKDTTVSPATAMPDASTTVAINGVVVDEDGKPATGVSVRTLTHSEHEPVAESDAQGRFQLRFDRNPMRGFGILASTADGARKAFFKSDWNHPPAKALPPVRLTMRRARSINVQVLDRAGKPVPGAIVGTVADYSGLDMGHSDEQGKFTLRVPAEAPLQNLYALKSGLGMDYLSLPNAERATTGDLPQPPDLSRLQILKLDGARTVRIKLIDPEGRPIVGIPVAPWYFQKPEWGRRDDLNISGVEDFQKKTDAAGVAVFDWIPSWNKQPIIFWPSDRNQWVRSRMTWNPEQDPSEKTVQLQRTVPVRGQVRHADGRPAAGILIQAAGVGQASPDQFRGQTWTDDSGRFEIRVEPDQVYLLAVSDDRWAAAPLAGIAVRPDTPVEGINFQLVQSATRLHGQLTLGPQKEPWPGQTVTLLQRGRDQDRAGPSILQGATSDAAGRYAFTIGPGHYTIWATGPTAEHKFTVTDQRELVYDFHEARKQRGMITVRVVDRGDPPRPVPHAQVVGVSVSSMSHAGLEATTNDEGWFRVERWLDKMIVSAYSKDKKLAGTVTIGADDAEVAVPIQPVGAAKGQLIDAATGQPAADRVIRYEVFYHYDKPAGAGSTFLIGSVTTDAEGRFQITRLTPGLEYELSVPMFKETGPAEMHRYDRFGKVIAKGGETVNLGEVKFRRDMTPGELLNVVLANRQPLDKRLKDMAAEAQRRGQRPLIMFWTNESRQHLADITHNDFKRFADYLVISSLVDQKEIEYARAAYAKEWGLEQSSGSWPLFCILDTDGGTLVVNSTQEFAKDGKVDDSLVNDFLKKYALKPGADRPGPAAKLGENHSDDTGRKTGGSATTAQPKKSPATSAPAATEVKKQKLAERTLPVHVVDVDGKPIRGAKILAAVWTKEPFAHTRNYVSDADGLAVVELPKTEETLRIWARKDGFVPMFAHWEQSWFDDGRPAPDDVTITLKKGTTIGGFVRNEAGQPIVGAKVGVAGPPNVLKSGVAIEHMEVDHWLAEGDTACVTDAAGRWTLDNVPAGDDLEVQLSVTHPDYIGDLSWGGLQELQNVTLASLREQKGTIVMPRGISLTGSVTDPQGKAVAGAVVVWGDDPYDQTGTHQEHRQQVRTDSNGVYRLPPLPPITVTVTVIAQHWMPNLKEVTLTREHSKVDFQLTPGKTLRIRFVDSSGKPVPGVWVGIERWRGCKSLYNTKHPIVLDTRIPTNAGKNGIFEWTWAPDDEVQYHFAKEGYETIRSKSLIADGTEHTITLAR